MVYADTVGMESGWQLRVKERGSVEGRPLSGTEQASDIVYSPDGRWIAYASSEQSELKNSFVSPFPNVDGGRWQISSGGGTEPAWSADGDELFFWGGPGSDGEMRVARIDTEAGFELLSVETLFPTPGGIAKDPDNRAFDVHPDGERFLMLRTLSEGDWGLIRVEDLFQVAREALGG